MKKLSQFQKFDFASFQAQKTFVIQGIKFNEQKRCVSLDVVITSDGTDYGDPTVSNIYQSFKVHCVNDTAEADINKYHIGDPVVFTSIGKCSVWGDYGSNLSVCAEVKTGGK